MAQRFHEELTGSELVVLEDTGHFVWDDAPERAVDALVDFLARRVG
jgi:pimeloyl-ACP methyl ester carboxylesterase